MLRQQAINKEKNLKLVIQEDIYVGYYLYIFDLTTDVRTHDHHYFQGQLENLYHHAFLDYGVSKDMFKDI
jgi:hypothetical protein